MTGDRVSTRKVVAITQQLCGHEFSASSISTITARLETQLEQFSRRWLAEEFPYVVLDARYERVREGGVIVSPSERKPARVSRFKTGHSEARTS